MKSEQLKELLKHIILEVRSQFPLSEMIANKDVPPDVFGAVNVESHIPGEGVRLGGFIIKFSDNTYVPKSGLKRVQSAQNAYVFESVTDAQNYARHAITFKEPKWEIISGKGTGAFEESNVEEGIFSSDVEKKAKDLFGKIKKITKISHPESNSEYFKIVLHEPDSEHTIRKDKEGKLSLGKETGGKFTFEPVEEETGTGAVAGYATPFAFKATGGSGERRRKKKKKHVRKESLLRKIKSKIKTNEKILPDGRYADDMEDGRRSNRLAGMSEQEIEDFSGRPSIVGKQIGRVSNIMYEKLPELEKSYSDAIHHKLSHIRIGGHTYATGYVKFIINTMKSAQSKQPELNEVSGTRYFAELQNNTVFKIPGHNIVFKKLNNEEAIVVNADKKKVKIKMKNDQSVNLIDQGSIREDTSSGAVFSGGPTIQTPAWGTKNKLGSPKAIKGSEKLGYKVVRSITNEGK